MSIENKTEFNGLVRKILTVLVEACPVPVEITAKTFELPEGEYESPSSASSIFIASFYNHSPQEYLLNSTLQWLKEEGFIRTGERDHYVATLQTLKAYGKVPNSLGE